MSAAAAQRPALGVLLILGMTLAFASMDTAVRHLGASLPVLLLLTGRYAFQALVMAGALLLQGGLPRLRPAHPRFQLLRGVLLLATSAFSFWGVQHMPVPEFTAINMLTPLLVTLLAAWLLREPVSALRWALVAGGFMGMLIVVRPGSGLFGWAVLYPMGCACSFAAFQMLTRRMAALEDPFTTHFWTGAVGTALLLPLLWASPIELPAVLAGASAGQLGLLLLIGALGTSGHLLLILALGLAPPSTLMPLVYVQIAVAAALGWWVFGTLPDAWAWVGMSVIAGCGATAAWLNLRRPAGRRSGSPSAWFRDRQRSETAPSAPPSSS